MARRCQWLRRARFRRARAAAPGHSRDQLGRGQDAHARDPDGFGRRSASRVRRAARLWRRRGGAAPGSPAGTPWCRVQPGPAIATAGPAAHTDPTVVTPPRPEPAEARLRARSRRAVLRTRRQRARLRGSAPRSARACSRAAAAGPTQSSANGSGTPAARGSPDRRPADRECHPGQRRQPPRPRRHGSPCPKMRAAWERHARPLPAVPSGRRPPERHPSRAWTG